VRATSPQHQALRDKVGAALRRARGEVSQVGFCKRLEPIKGSQPGVDQWGRYERGTVDAPAWVLPAASIASGMSLSEMFEQEDVRTFDTLAQGLVQTQAALDVLMTRGDYATLARNEAKRAAPTPVTRAEVDGIEAETTALLGLRDMDGPPFLHQHYDAAIFLLEHWRQDTLGLVEVGGLLQALSEVGAWRDAHGGDPVRDFRRRWRGLLRRMARDVLARKG